MPRRYERHAKEKTLCFAIVAAPILAVPVVPAAILHIHAVIVAFSILASLAGGFVVLFYAGWIFALIMDPCRGERPELIGDDYLDCSALYWPFGPKQRYIRRVRRIRELESACGITDEYPVGW